ncbi:hypothetical protein [Alloalcanivorax xenomutans]|uniref:Uncharacterized protein n=1 Tax=Alloalcanivorax xenomutans TaxID=1094342 RepID=A0A9Q3W5E5_9GAMM|nr:hypothetical protein [Alloalcanivorax xenomutans]MCE7508879.1 hypothetical protein [Alloalcanivorax xenomutans]
MSEYRIYPHNIISMTPAGYWGARFDGAEEIVPLVCWALIEAEGETKIKGMVAGEHQQVLPCDCFNEFLCYEPAKQNIDTRA